MREWEVMAPITGFMPLGGACAILSPLSPNWNEGNHALSALQGGESDTFRDFTWPQMLTAWKTNAAS